jgi:hypothetical protein
MLSRICPSCQAAVIGLTCLCLVSLHADAHTHEKYGPVQTVPLIPNVAYAVLSGSSLRPPLSFPPTWRKGSSLRPPLSFPPNWRRGSSLRPPLSFPPTWRKGSSLRPPLNFPP